MPTYTNGFIPESLLVRFNSGWNSTDGDWHHSLSPATLARHRALVARALNRTGKVLAISLGWSAYRPYDAQVLARKIHGNYAATPGTSSHGGLWEGRQTLAMDYGNWAAVYAAHGGQAAFFEDCRAVGLSPGLIMRSRGYPDEPWHVVDLNPWSAVPSFTGASAFPNTSAPEVEEQDFDMEAYVIVPSGSVVHFVPGKQYVFKSQQEYETYAKEVEFIRARGGIDVMPVPPLSTVVGVSWATYKRLQANFGAPADGAVNAPLVDVDALAAQLAGKLGIDVTAVRAAVRAELATLTLKAG